MVLPRGFLPIFVGCARERLMSLVLLCVRALTLLREALDKREGFDYFETSSPCPSVTSIRLLVAFSNELSLELCHFDAEYSFIQSDLQEVVSIRLPPGRYALSGQIIRL